MTTPPAVGLVETARAWVAQDPDPHTRADLEDLLDRATGPDERIAAAAGQDLASRFAGPLEFGTAGLRGPVGAGESRMNVAVVMRATAGLAHYLVDVLAAAGADVAAAPPQVVLGCDARHGSAQFARAAARVLAGAGCRALVLPASLPTPVTAFAVRALGADAGIMVTASHNPATDNGYKVYLGGRMTDDEGAGVQIIPPADADIAARIAASPGAAALPVSPGGEPAGGIEAIDQQLVEEYVARAASLRAPAEPSPIRLVLTPMHGVGGATAASVLHGAGFRDVHLVESQARPDPDFPTVAFPNPEEPGALDLALELAARVDADLIVALDPDADRCSAAIPLRSGGWRQLTGDEIGAVLGEQAAADPHREGDTLASSVVSSRLLGHVAAAHGLRHEVTLTGFKWIARTPGLRFGYEEAIGYCTDPQAVRDKDGITAAVRLATLVDELRHQGRTLEDMLDDLARAHGLHATAPLSFRVDDLALIAGAMDRLRRAPARRLAGAAVTDVRDLARPAPGHSASAADLPPTDAVVLHTEAGDRVTVRPSGTEPKLKCYLEVVLPCENGVVPREEASTRLGMLARDVSTMLGLQD